MSILFTSDTHFFHEKVIGYSNRPFKTGEEMNEYMIQQWNRKVSPNDTIYHLGDFSFAREDKTERVLQRLNGKKILILGNHDKGMKSLFHYFETVTSYHELKQGSDTFILCHYPMARWNKGHYGSYMLHGHCHASYTADGRIMDVGVDNCNYAPITLEEVVDKLKDKQFTFHHE